MQNQLCYAVKLELERAGYSFPISAPNTADPKDAQKICSDHSTRVHRPLSSTEEGSNAGSECVDDLAAILEMSRQRLQTILDKQSEVIQAIQDRQDLEEVRNSDSLLKKILTRKWWRTKSARASWLSKEKKIEELSGDYEKAKPTLTIVMDVIRLREDDKAR